VVAALCLLVPSAVLAEGTLQGTPGPDVLSGTPGADTIFGLAGNDRIDGGGGNDDLDGGPGADDIHGGAGADSVLYGARKAPVAVSLNDLADDGQQGEADNVHSDVEQIYGGDAGDRLNGSARDEVIDGGGGDDSIVDGGGSDHDYGGAGNDAITAFDADVDIVDCGPGNDVATADSSDVLIGCEKRLPGPRISASVTFTFVIQGAHARVNELAVRELSGGGSVEVRCHGNGCPFATNRLKTKPGQTRVVLTGLFHGHVLHAGATLDVRVSAPQKIGRVERFAIRSGKRVKHTVLCLPPGSDRPRPKC
jgi:Ca2+-binding RTX toxin-like protein